MWPFTALTHLEMHKLEGRLSGRLMAGHCSADVDALGRLLVGPSSQLV